MRVTDSTEAPGVTEVTLRVDPLLATVAEAPGGTLPRHVVVAERPHLQLLKTGVPFYREYEEPRVADEAATSGGALLTMPLGSCPPFLLLTADVPLGEYN